jgi:ankyrin repeat protein
MDPLSITAAAVGLATFCTQIVTTLSQFASDSTRVDTAVRAFSDEITALYRVLHSISISFADPSVSSLPALTGHEGQHWSDVHRSLGDCKLSLERLAKILEKVKAAAEGNGVLRRARKQFTLNMRAGEIVTLRSQIVSYTQTIQISLQMISLSSQIADRSSTAMIAPRLDDLTEEIRRVLITLRISLRDNDKLLRPETSDLELREPSQENERILKENRRIFEENGRALKENGRTLEENKRALDENGRTLEKNGRNMEENGRTLEENTRTLKDSERIMEDSKRILKDSERITEESERMTKENERIVEDSDRILSLENPRQPLGLSARQDECDALPQGLPSNSDTHADRANQETHLLAADPGILNPDTEILELNHTVMANLETCVISAGKIVSTASTLLTTSSRGGGSICGSDFGDVLTHDRRRYVESWIPGRDTELYSSGSNTLAQSDEQAMADAPGLDEDDSDSDVESDVIKSLQRTGRQRFEAAEYSEAEGFLQKSIHLLETKKGLNFEGRDEMFEMLVTSFLNQRKWSEAETALLHFIKGRPEREAKMLSSLHILAEVYLEKLELDNAEKYCQRAVKGRKKVLGRGNPLFLESVDLLIEIYERKGDVVAARGYTATFLPDGIRNGGRTWKNANRMLLDNGFRLEKMDQTSKSQGLRWAATEGHENVVRVLIGKDSGIREIVDVKDRVGKTALHLASLYGHHSVCSLLLENGADVEMRAACSMTSIHLAACQGHEQTVKILLDHGAAIERTTHSGETALHWAVKNGHLNVINLLLARGANIEASDYGKSRALHMACAAGQTAVVRLLLEHRADVKAGDVEGGTPLHWASWHGHEHNVQLLLEHDADIEARGVAGGTPLRGAAMHGHFNIVRILLDQGANTEVRNASGKTALDEAAKRGHRDVVHLLQLQMARA